MSDPLWVVDCGLVPYDDALDAQRLIGAARKRGEIPDTVLLLEHLPVYTRGRRSDPAELPMGVQWYEAQGIEVRDTDRGGRVTYHGPGQLVAYPIVELLPAASSASRPGAAGSASPPASRPGAAGSASPPASRPGARGRGFDVVGFVRLLERVMVGALADWGIEAGTIDGLTGVWTPARRKIGSIGIHVSRGVTTHGLAVNVNNDLQPFEWIVPCGIDDCRMTSVGRELGAEQDLARFSGTLCEHLGTELARGVKRVGAEELAARIAGLGALTRGAATGALP